MQKGDVHSTLSDSTLLKNSISGYQFKQIIRLVLKNLLNGTLDYYNKAKF